MATRKKVQIEEVKEPEVEAVEVVAIEPEPEPVDLIAAKAEQIKSFFAELGNVEGIEVDLNNPDHQLIMAFYVGQRNLIRR